MIVWRQRKCMKEVFRIARQRERDSRDIQQVRVIKDASSNVLTNEEMVCKRWRDYILEVAELRMIRFALGVTRLDRIKNEYVRSSGDKLREARLRWFGHVKRKVSILVE